MRKATVRDGVPVKPEKMIHREAIRGVPGGPVIAYYRGGPDWQVYWTPEGTGEPAKRHGPFASLNEARMDAERHYAPKAT